MGCRVEWSRVEWSGVGEGVGVGEGEVDRGLK